MATHDSFEAAREQAAEYLGFAASERINGFEIPNPSLLSDEQQERVDTLDIEMDEKWDRYPDALNEDGSIKQRGALKVPYRKAGKPVNYNIRLAQAIFGEQFEAFKAAGGKSSDVQLIWSKMNRELTERRAADSKSGGSASPMAAVSASDSQ